MNQLGDLEKIEDRVRYLCRKWGCPRDDENDVVQEVYLLMLEKERKIENATSQAIHNVCQNPLASLPGLVDLATPLKLAEDREERERLLARLTLEDREVAQLLEEGYTLLEVCDKLGLQYKNLHAHLEELKQRVEAGGALYPDRGGLFMPGGECKVQSLGANNLS